GPQVIEDVREIDLAQIGGCRGRHRLLEKEVQRARRRNWSLQSGSSLWAEICSTTSRSRPRRDLKEYCSGSLNPYSYSPWSAAVRLATDVVTLASFSREAPWTMGWLRGGAYARLRWTCSPPFLQVARPTYGQGQGSRRLPLQPQHIRSMCLKTWVV